MAPANIAKLVNQKRRTLPPRRDVFSLKEGRVYRERNRDSYRFLNRQKQFKEYLKASHPERRWTITSDTDLSSSSEGSWQNFLMENLRIAKKATGFSTDGASQKKSNRDDLKDQFMESQCFVTEKLSNLESAIWKLNSKNITGDHVKQLLSLLTRANELNEEIEEKFYLAYENNDTKCMEQIIVDDHRPVLDLIEDLF